MVHHPFLGRTVAAIFRSQLEEYRRLFGRDPEFFNGHHHLHLSPNMIVGRLPPPGSTVRRSEAFFKGEKKQLRRSYGRLVDAWVLRSRASSDAFFNLIPVDDRARLTRIVEIAKTSRVELMVHPWMPDNYEFLMGPAFEILTASVLLGNFSDLRPGGAGRATAS